MPDPSGASGASGAVAVPPLPLGREEIEAILPHRAPFLFVDQVIELEPARRAVGLKAVSRDEPYFAGHFPGRPTMPGVLILEALAQLGAICLLSHPIGHGKLPLFGGVDWARFRAPVIPDETLRLETEIVRTRGDLGRGRGKAFLSDGRLAAEAGFTFYLARQG